MEALGEWQLLIKHLRRVCIFQMAPHRLWFIFFQCLQPWLWHLSWSKPQGHTGQVTDLPAVSGAVSLQCVESRPVLLTAAISPPCLPLLCQEDVGSAIISSASPLLPALAVQGRERRFPRNARELASGRACNRLQLHKLPAGAP